MKKYKILKNVGIIVIICGIILISLPFIFGIVIEQNIKKVVKEFDEKEQQTINKGNNDEDTNLKILREKFEEYNKKLYENGQELIDAFSYQDKVFDLSKYGYVENIVGTIYVPKINIKLPIYIGATKNNLSKGATYLSQTSLPIGGLNSNCVIAAHNGYGGADMFKNLYSLRAGDTIYIKNYWEELKYEVYDMQVIEPTEISKILIEPKKDLLTLITCYPHFSNAKRYVVYCSRII